MDTYYLILTIVLGLVVGSFLNVVIHRVPRKMKLALERSACPKCKTPLKWYHNIPVLSYLVLGDKCGFCKERISLRYPLVELLNGAFWAVFYWQFGLTVIGAAYAALASALLVIFFIDLDFQIIPDSVTLPGMVFGLAVSFAPGGIGIVSAGIGLLVGGGALYLMAVLGDWLFKKESMGGGDIKMCAMLGAFLGWQKVLFIFLSSAVIGLAVSIVVMIFSSKLRESRMIPFGPFLAAAAMLAMVYGDQIIDFYLTRFVGI